MRTIFRCLALTFICVVISSAAAATTGVLDSSFGSGGVVTTSFGTGSHGASSVAIQSDGKIVAAGYWNQRFALARYTTNGTLDASFGGNGTVTTLVGAGGGGARSIAIQSDGKIVAAGSVTNGSATAFALVRYNTDGALDATFGNGTGIVTTAIGVNGSRATGVVIQPDGKIVAAGYSIDVSNKRLFAVARYNSDGSLDLTVTTAIGTVHSTASAVTLQSDGKIVVAGNCTEGIAVVRYKPDGNLDGEFGTGGKVIIASPSQPSSLRKNVRLVRFSGSSSPLCLAFGSKSAGVRRLVVSTTRRAGPAGALSATSRRPTDASGRG